MNKSKNKQPAAGVEPAILSLEDLRVIQLRYVGLCYCVELAVDDSDEEIPDFIKSWNIHKTKRFRPTVPRRDKQTKRQRTVAPVRCPPRNTRTQYKYIDRYDK